MNYPTKNKISDLLKAMLQEMVDNPSEVIVKESQAQNLVLYEIILNRNDIKLVVGKHGKNIQALKTIISAMGYKYGYVAHLRIIE